MSTKTNLGGAVIATAGPVASPRWLDSVAPPEFEDCLSTDKAASYVMNRSEGDIVAQAGQAKHERLPEAADAVRVYLARQYGLLVDTGFTVDPRRERTLGEARGE
jgi:hypothetical protein